MKAIKITTPIIQPTTVTVTAIIVLVPVTASDVTIPALHENHDY